MTISKLSLLMFWYEPTDIHKAAKPFESELWKLIDFASPNFNELRVMCVAAGMNDIPPTAFNLANEELVEKATAMALFLANSISTVIATLGHLGIIVCRKENADQPFFLLSSNGQRRLCLRKLALSSPQARYYPAPICQPVSVSGAGDCWNAGFISAALQGESEASCVKAGFKAALCSLAVASAVPTSFQVLPPNDNQCIAVSQ